MGETRFITVGRFIDGSGSDVRRDIFLAVKDGIITEIGPVAKLPRDTGAEIDDFPHCVILPALVDCSVSLGQSPSVDVGVRSSIAVAGRGKKTALLTQHISYCQSHGVLGVAVSDDIIDLLTGWRKEQAQGDIINIRTADHLNGRGTDINQPGGDFIKINYSGNIEDNAVPSTPRPNHASLCRVLQQRGAKKAVVLANGPQQVGEALAAGCDAIEQGYDMGDANLRTMVAQDVLWIPSVLRAKNALDGACSGGEVCCRFSLRYVAPGKPIPGAEIFWKKRLAEQLGQLRLAKKMGVKTAIGTGAGSVGILHGESMVEEMKLFIKSGYSLEETIRCASDTGADFFGMENMGTLRVGRPATFLVARGSVKQLPRKLSYLEGIYVSGGPSPTYRKN